MRRCNDCGHPTEVQKLSAQHRLGRYRFSGKVRAYYCPQCRFNHVDGRALDRFERSVAMHIARKGLMGSATFRFLRRASGLRGSELASILGVSKSTLWRWEHGSAPQRAAFATLCALTKATLEGKAERAKRLQRRRASEGMGEQETTLVGEHHAASEAA